MILPNIHDNTQLLSVLDLFSPEQIATAISYQVRTEPLCDWEQCHLIALELSCSYVQSTYGNSSQAYRKVKPVHDRTLAELETRYDR